MLFSLKSKKRFDKKVLSNNTKKSEKESGLNLHRRFHIPLRDVNQIFYKQ